MRTFEIVPARQIGAVTMGGETFPIVEVTAGGKRALLELHARLRDGTAGDVAKGYDAGIEVAKADLAVHIPTLRPEVLATLTDEGFFALHRFVCEVVEEAAKTGSREIVASPTSPASCA